MADGQVNRLALSSALFSPAQQPDQRTAQPGFDLLRFGRALFPDQGDEQIGAAIERSRGAGRDDRAIIGEGAELARQRVPREHAARMQQIQQQYQDERQRVEAQAAEKRRASTKWRLLGGLGAALGGQNPGAINAHFDQLEQLNLESGMGAARERRDAATSQLGMERDQARAGRDDLLFQQQQEDRQREAAVRAREDDPNSEESRIAQELAARFGGRPYPGMTAAQFKRAAPHLQAIYETQQRKILRQDAAAERDQARAAAQADREAARADVVAQRQADRIAAADLRKGDRLETEERKIGEKKAEQTREIEEFAQSGLDALDRLQKQIEDQGTFEMFGPETQNFERHRTSIANAMARLADPGSVNRPSEVETALRGLPVPGLGQANDTALELIAAARDEIEQRRRRAYKIRGIEDPEPVGQPRDVRGNVVDDPPAAEGAAPVAAPPEIEALLEKYR